MDLMKMDSIVSYYPKDFDITLEPGVPRIALNEYVKADGLWFPVGKRISLKKAAILLIDEVSI